VVLITGASRGIGAEIALAALQYARAGAKLTLMARDQTALDASKDAIRMRMVGGMFSKSIFVVPTTSSSEAVSYTPCRTSLSPSIA